MKHLHQPEDIIHAIFSRSQSTLHQDLVTRGHFIRKLDFVQLGDSMHIMRVGAASPTRNQPEIRSLRNWQLKVSLRAPSAGQFCLAFVFVSCVFRQEKAEHVQQHEMGYGHQGNLWKSE